MSDLVKEVGTKQKLADEAINVSDELHITDEEVSKARRELKMKSITAIAFGVVVVITLVARLIYG